MPKIISTLKSSQNQSIENCVRNSICFSSPLLIHDDWCWDINAKSPCVNLNGTKEIAYFFDDPFDITQGSAGIRGTKGFKYGIHYYEIIINEPLYGTSIMIGYGTEDTCLHYDNFNYVNLIGNNDHSWGLCHRGTTWHDSISQVYCEPFFDTKTTIGVLLNLNNNTLSYFKNGKYLGVAFRSLETNGKERRELYPIISSTATEIELELGKRFSILVNLQDICLNEIKGLFKNYDDLPLPKQLIRYLNKTTQ